MSRYYIIDMNYGEIHRTDSTLAVDTFMDTPFYCVIDTKIDTAYQDSEKVEIPESDEELPSDKYSYDDGEEEEGPADPEDTPEE